MFCLAPLTNHVFLRTGSGNFSRPLRPVFWGLFLLLPVTSQVSQSLASFDDFAMLCQPRAAVEFFFILFFFYGSALPLGVTLQRENIAFLRDFLFYVKT